MNLVDHLKEQAIYWKTWAERWFWFSAASMALNIALVAFLFWDKIIK